MTTRELSHLTTPSDLRQPRITDSPGREAYEAADAIDAGGIDIIEEIEGTHAAVAVAMRSAVFGRAA